MVRKLFLFFAAVLLGGAAAPAQSVSEAWGSADQSSVSVGRGVRVQEVSGGRVHLVNVTVRHCQEYMSHPNLFGRLFLRHRAVVDAAGCANDASTVFYTHTAHNLRTTAGGDWQSSVMGNTSAPPATCNYIALTNDAGAAAAGDTTLASEIAANGLSRAIGVYAHTGGTAAYTISKVFTATGTQASQKTGLFNASSSGTLCFENTYTSVTVNNGDTLTVTWTINY
jgi:hypothetical protein